VVPSTARFEATPRRTPAGRRAGFSFCFARHEIAAAFAAGDKAIALNKYDATVMSDYGGRLVMIAAMAGDRERAVNSVERLVALNPARARTRVANWRDSSGRRTQRAAGARLAGAGLGRRQCLALIHALEAHQASIGNVLAELHRIDWELAERLGVKQAHKSVAASGRS
jgi:hypothetical protein